MSRGIKQYDWWGLEHRNTGSAACLTLCLTHDCGGGGEELGMFTRKKERERERGGKSY